MYKVCSFVPPCKMGVKKTREIIKISNALYLKYIAGEMHWIQISENYDSHTQWGQNHYRNRIWIFALDEMILHKFLGFIIYRKICVSCMLKHVHYCRYPGFRAKDSFFLGSVSDFFCLFFPQWSQNFKLLKIDLMLNLLSKSL